MSAATARARHVILVVFDTLRRDAVSCYGTPPPWGAIATPNLDAFAAESVTFTRAYPEALPTLCARRSIYTGLRTYPFHNGDFRHIKGDFVGIARLSSLDAKRGMETYVELRKLHRSLGATTVHLVRT